MQQAHSGHPEKILSICCTSSVGVSNKSNISEPMFAIYAMHMVASPLLVLEYWQCVLINAFDISGLVRVLVYALAIRFVINYK